MSSRCQGYVCRLAARVPKPEPSHRPRWILTGLGFREGIIEGVGFRAQVTILILGRRV